VRTAVVIDDTQDMRDLLRLVLEAGGKIAVVAEAGDGAAGIAAVEAEQPDLVLLDLRMPVMDGLQALPGIKGACPSAKVVVLSAFNSDVMAQRAVTAGADAYLQKGLAPQAILSFLMDLFPPTVPRQSGPRTRQSGLPDSV
jgi:DNA-binding NarL/FixJ family response regulator